MIRKSWPTVVFLGVITGGCSLNRGPASTGSSVSVQFPQVSANGKAMKIKTAAVPGGSYDFSLACFAVNITASDIPTTSPASTCAIPTGIFQGFVAPGGTISVSVPTGTGRTLEVFSYLRTTASDSCPTGLVNLQGLDPSKVLRLGEVQSFDTLLPQVSVTVNLANPGDMQNLVSQYSLPSSCIAATAPSTPSAGVVAGQSTTSGGAYTAVGTVSGLKNEMTLQGGNYMMRMSRRAQ